MRLFTLSGAVVASASIARTSAGGPSVVGTTPDEAFIFDGSSLFRLSRRGELTTIAHFPAGAQLAVSPDGRQWVWVTIDHATNFADPADKSTSTVYEAGIDLPQRVVLTQQARGTISLYGWMQAGVLVDPRFSGGGGAPPFGEELQGPASFLDLTTGTLTPLRDCQVSAGAADGTLVCVRAGRPAHIEVRFPDGHVLDVSFPGRTDVGSAALDLDARLLAVGVANTDDPSGRHFGTEVVSLTTGEAHPIGPDYTTPRRWLPDGRLLCDGPGGFYVFAARGSASGPTPYPAGLTPGQLSLLP